VAVTQTAYFLFNAKHIYYMPGILFLDSKLQQPHGCNTYVLSCFWLDMRRRFFCKYTKWLEYPYLEQEQQERQQEQEQERQQEQEQEHEQEQHPWSEPILAIVVVVLCVGFDVLGEWLQLYLAAMAAMAAMV
jgi:hypothetical protein